MAYRMGRTRRGFAGICACAVAASLAAGPAAAQSQPSQDALAAQTAKRFPQSVRVGDLLHRVVQKPLESHDAVGRVAQVVRGQNGVISVVVRYGGVLGVGARNIAVPLDAIVSVGSVVEIVGLTPQELRSLPTYRPREETPLPDDAEIKIGLGKPSH